MVRQDSPILQTDGAPAPPISTPVLLYDSLHLFQPIFFFTNLTSDFNLLAILSGSDASCVISGSHSKARPSFFQSYIGMLAPLFRALCSWSIVPTLRCFRNSSSIWIHLFSLKLGLEKRSCMDDKMVKYVLRVWLYRTNKFNNNNNITEAQQCQLEALWDSKYINIK